MEVLAIFASLLVLAALCGGLLCFPSWRDAIGQLSRSSRRAVIATPLNAGRDGVRWLDGKKHLVRAQGRGFACWARSHRYWLLAAVFAALIPVGMAWWMASDRALGQFEDRVATRDPVLAAVLEGEHLVPPSPLPPEVFATRELQLERPEIVTASRDWMLLDAEFRQRLLVLFSRMKQQGYELALLEGYRSPERQQELAAMGPHVTRAGAFQSYHQFGLAADIAFFRAGRIVISERDPWAMEGYRQLGELGESLGLVWGGRWKMMDFGHVELRRAGVLNRR